MTILTTSRSRRRRLALVALAAVASLGAVGVGQQLYGSLPALLLAAADGAPIETGLLSKAAQTPWPEVRRWTAEVLAVRADPAAVPLIDLLVSDRNPRVRAAAVLAAGRVGSPAARAVAEALSGPSAFERQAAVWAACQIRDGTLRSQVLARLAVETDPGVLETLLANLWRLDNPQQWLSRCERWAAHENVTLRRAAAYSLARVETTEPPEALLRLANDPEPVIRLTALNGLARHTVGGTELEAAAKALVDSDWRVRAAACAVLAAADDIAQAPEGVAEALAAAAGSAHPHLVVAAVRVLSAHQGIADGGVLRQRLEDSGEPWFAEEALIALTARGWEGAADTARAWSGADELWRRVAAVRAAGAVSAEVRTEILHRAVRDPASPVRVAAVEALRELGHSELLAQLVASEADAIVRGAALAVLCEVAPPSPERLAGLYRSWREDAEPQARAAALRCLLSQSPDSEQAVKVLETAERDRSRLVRAVVANHRRARGEPLEVRREARHGHQWYERLMPWRQETHWLDVVTVRGTFRCRLATATAPLTTRELVALAESGTYDGLTFHRVVPNFVVQGGDPRGDGWGGAGLVLPDEPSLTPFDSWMVGVATDGPGTGGSQLFVTLVPADHLTGMYTNVGEVTEGREVLERLRRWDTIIQVRHHSGDDPEPIPRTLVSTVQWRDLAALPGWQEEYEAYRPDPDALQRLSDLEPEGRIVVVLGTWCADSRREVPRLLAVLHALGDAADLNVSLHAVDRSKRVVDPDRVRDLLPSGTVDRVATMIIADRENRELGRIVETPAAPIETLLADLFDRERQP